MPIDPFRLKQLSTAHPRRLAYTAWARYQDWKSRRHYERYALPLQPPPDGPGSSVPVPQPGRDTAVTGEQFRCLEAALRATEHLAGTSVVEVGAYRGVTTRFIAQRTARPVVAVDPYMGYYGGEADLNTFLANTADLSNVSLCRQTSGRGRAQWVGGRSISLLFIDAVHDYANTRFDIAAWQPLVVTGGIVAMHDVDEPGAAGTRRAAAELSAVCPLFAHVNNLAAFRVP